MKASLLSTAAALVAGVFASPVPEDPRSDYTRREPAVPRQASDTANEFLEGGCRDVIFIYARGTTQDGNIGDAPGPQTIDLLKAALGDAAVAAQGVEYPASLLDNLREGGCDPEDAEKMAALITQAATECPDAQLVVSGFSQGAAMVHRSVEQLDTATAGRIAAGVTYGDTQKAQDNGGIPGLAADRTHIICHDGDLVCEGTLIVTEAHHGYENEAPEAVEFIVGKL
ncbi:hypothetical protein SLS62_007882 [Diatrype stigma]|uniref:cutinase n=1 Tax=Diatrype stigma TaxID=117547 RepID=A0AAN9UVU6_9PEZI